MSQTTLKALIIDDEPLAHVVIQEYAKEVSFLEIVGQCHLATEALTFLKDQEVDLLFLDINMPKLKGLDFLRVLQKKPMVIITSAYQEYALESFELDVNDYLLKPFRFDRFLKAVNKVHELASIKQTIPTSDSTTTTKNPTEEAQQIFIKSDKRLINLNIGNIYYLESYGNYVKVWLEKEFHLTPNTLTSFEGKLPTTDFFRIHKSYIIHRQYIDYVEGNFVKMKNGRQLPIGKNQRSTFKQFIG